MPLKPGVSDEIVSGNISELMGSGYKQKQAIAAALAEKRRSQKAHGGEVESEPIEGNEASLAAALIPDGPREEVPMAPAAPVEEPQPSHPSLDERQRQAIMAKKKKRVFVQ